MNTGFMVAQFYILSYLLRKTGQSAPGPFKKSNHSCLSISATVDAFRGHGFSPMSSSYKSINYHIDLFSVSFSLSFNFTAY